MATERAREAGAAAAVTAGRADGAADSEMRAVLADALYRSRVRVVYS